MPNCCRRVACQSPLLIAAASGLCSSASAQTFPQGIASGDTYSIASLTVPGNVFGYGQAWARTTAPGTVTFEISTTPDFAAILQTGTVQVTDTTIPAKFSFFRLLLSEPEVYYRVTDSAGTVQTGRTVVPWIGHRLGMRFGVSGDWRGELSPYPAIANADELGLDLFVELGDTIYADFPSPAVPLAQATTLAELRAKHAEVYSDRFGSNTWADLRAVTPVLATIDDHEVTNDFEGGASPAGLPLFATPAGVPFVNDTDLYRDGIRAFVEYNPIANIFYSGSDPADRFASAPNLYRERVYGSDAAFFVLDARSFRDPGIPEVTNPADPVQVGTFLATSFTPGRTMLGGRQLDALLGDLLQAQQNGVTWKFVFVPEPIQNLGVLAASDRFEGYAAERTQILSFIDQNRIDNVVFVAADIHGTVINNLTYQVGPFQPQIETQAFEVTTGSVAFDAPFGPTVVSIAGGLGILSPAEVAGYFASPLPVRDAIVEGLINAQIVPLGYSPVGLGDSTRVFSRRTAGIVSSATSYFGWTQFDIDAQTRELTVTTYGIEPYTEQQLLADPASIAGRVPTVVNQFIVTPVTLCADVNRDDIISPADFSAWIDAFTSGSTAADQNGDGTVTPADFSAWVQNFNAGPAGRRCAF